MGGSPFHFNNVTRPGIVRAKLIEAQALKLRATGQDYDQIAETMGLTRDQAARAVRRGIKAAKEEAKEQASQIVDLELIRLDMLLLVAMNEVQVNKNLDGIDKVLKIMDRRAKYLGLDAAQKIVQTNEPGTLDLMKLSGEDLEKLEAIAAKTLGGQDDGPDEDLSQPVEYGPTVGEAFDLT